MRAQLRDSVRQTEADEGTSPELKLGQSWTLPETYAFEVLGFVRDRTIGLMVVWRDDAGTIHELPAWAVRMIPNTVTPPDVNIGSLDPVTRSIAAAAHTGGTRNPA